MIWMGVLEELLRRMETSSNSYNFAKYYSARMLHLGGASFSLLPMGVVYSGCYMIHGDKMGFHSSNYNTLVIN